MNIQFVPKPKGGKFLSPNSKFPFNSISKKVKIRGLLFLIALFFSFFPKQMWAQCSGGFRCIGGLNISVDENCTFNIHPSQFFTNYASLPTACADILHVLVTDENDNFIAQGDQVTFDVNAIVNLSTGDFIKVTVFEDIDGSNTLNGSENYCWGGARIKDGIDPIIAGDVNNSGGLTALDLAQIRNLILLNISEFPN